MGKTLWHCWKSGLFIFLTRWLSMIFSENLVGILPTQFHSPCGFISRKKVSYIELQMLYISHQADLKVAEHPLLFYEKKCLNPKNPPKIRLKNSEAELFTLLNHHTTAHLCYWTKVSARKNSLNLFPHSYILNSLSGTCRNKLKRILKAFSKTALFHNTNTKTKILKLKQKTW